MTRANAMLDWLELLTSPNNYATWNGRTFGLLHIDRHSCRKPECASIYMILAVCLHSLCDPCFQSSVFRWSLLPVISLQVIHAASRQSLWGSLLPVYMWSLLSVFRWALLPVFSLQVIPAPFFHSLGDPGCQSAVFRWSLLPVCILQVTPAASLYCLGDPCCQS